MVIRELSAIVGLDASEGKGWSEELSGALEEIYRVGRVHAWIDTFVLNPRRTVDDVVLVAFVLPLLNVHLPNFAWVVLAVAEPSRFAHSLLAFL